jgi:ribosomal protein L37AE/L43A
MPSSPGYVRDLAQEDNAYDDTADVRGCLICPERESTAIRLPSGIDKWSCEACSHTWTVDWRD